MINERKQHLLNSLAKGVRYDGRKLTELRKIVIESDISRSAEGSARVKFGGTEIIVGIKTAVEKPFPDTPEDGNLMVNAELRPIANPDFEPGPPGEQAIEIARVIDRTIREAKAIDTKKLCIKPAEEVWSVIIDICPINDEGNLLDVGSVGALAALKSTKFPKREDKKIDYLTRTEESLPLLKEPLAITVFKIGPYFIVDPLSEEEQYVDARLTVGITSENIICALQKGGADSLTQEEIKNMVDIAMEKASEIRKLL
ncbi:MAG: exosome complex protein Rrp42 [Nanoarchaeota archaeon]